jgi:signal transduction histidine kinase
MANKLGLLVCGNLEREVAGLVQSCRFDDVIVLGFPAECTRQGPDWQVLGAIVDADGGDCQQVRLLGGKCLAGIGPQPSHLGRCQTVPVGWCADTPRQELLRLLVEKTVLEWRLDFQRTKLNAILANAYRRLTDYTMVQELVGSLTETLAEDKVIEKVFELFAALLAPTTMVFASVGEGQLDKVWSKPPGYGDKEEVRTRLASFRRAYAWTEDGNGFRVSIRHRSRTLGVLEVTSGALHEYKEHYLDLALVITRVCGLALSNARLYRELKGPNRASLEFAEDLRDALVGRKKAEEKQAQLLSQVEAVNKELNDFAYVVSHDLKAPLRAIDSLARWLMADYGDRFDEDGKEQMNLLVSRVDRMRALIDGILQYSRAGRTREEKSEVNLAAIVPEVIDALAPPSHIKVTVEGELPMVVGDKVRLEQVFQNLLSNAVKYMDKAEGLVRIGCIGEDGFWRFHVADNGPGIEEKDFERVFQLFQTLRPRDEADSTGIGLSVVKKIVELYGGRIWVESKVGSGSTFCFTLPKAPKAEGS